MTDFEKSIDKMSEMMYYDSENDTLGGDSMKSNDLLAAALKAVNTTQAEAAKRIGWKPTQLSQRIVRNSMRADELLDLLEAVGIDLTLTVKATGEVVRTRITGAGRPVRGMVDRILYNTATSSALANNFYADGVNMYTEGRALELYIDKENRYFFAEYYEWEGAKDRIVPVTAKDAAAFISKYGTEIDKTPKTDTE